jgi:transposase InsO family protein
MLCKVRRRVGGRRISREIRHLIFQMVSENPTWGAPRIHGELRMLGFDVSERTISRWMRRAPRNSEPARRWMTFLRNHREAIAAMDFFTVPTLTFNLLYCFFIISHDRRHILHCNVTRHPTSSWIVQQLRDAFPYQSAPKFVLFDHDQKYGLEVPAAIRSMNISPVRTSFRSPWQNGIAERWAGSCRRDLTDHVIALDERHLKRLLSEYMRYYHDDRTHLGLGKETPGGRVRSAARGGVVSTLDSAACITDTTVRRKRHNKMTGVLLSCSPEKCLCSPANASTTWPGNISLPERTLIQARNSHLPRTISDAASIVATHRLLPICRRCKPLCSALKTLPAELT